MLSGIIILMNNNRSNGLGKFIAGLGLGAAAGIAAGLLMADRPGSELRRDIEANSSEFLEGLKERIDELKDHASDTIREFKGFADEKLKASAKNIQTQVDSLGKQLQELTHKQTAGSSTERN